MTQTITLRHTTFTLAGTVDGWTKQTLSAEIKRQGGTIAGSLHSKTDVLLAGEGGGRTVGDALYRGVPVLRGGQIEELVAQGSVVWSPPPPTYHTEHEAFGALRGILQEHFHAGAWPSLTRALDMCAPEVAEHATHYTRQHIEAWEQRHPTQHHYRHEWRTEDGDPHGFPDGAREAMFWWGLQQQWTHHWRLAPLGWLGELGRAERHPKHTLITALSLDGTNQNASQLAAILDQPADALPDLHELCIGHQAKVSRTLTRTLDQSPALGRLRTLRVDTNPMATGRVEELCAARSTAGITTLELAAHQHLEHLAILREAPWRHTVRALRVSTLWDAAQLEATVERWPALEHLHVAGIGEDWARSSIAPSQLLALFARPLILSVTRYEQLEQLGALLDIYPEAAACVAQWRALDMHELLCPRPVAGNERRAEALRTERAQRARELMHYAEHLRGRWELLPGVWCGDCAPDSLVEHMRALGATIRTTDPRAHLRADLQPTT